MTKKERIDAALTDQDVDKVPISFWRHFLLQERDPSLLADALLAFQREFQWDFMKVNPRASYHVEDWGNRYSYSDDPNESPTLASYLVHSDSDWTKVRALDIWQAGVLKQQLVLLELIREGLQDENVYFLQTIFSPLSVAHRLAGHSRDRLVSAMQNEPRALHAALDAIAQTFISYASACLDAGAGGIFFATTKLASADMVTAQQYDEFGTPYDVRVLGAVQDRTGFNLLHLCADNIFFEKLMGYPVDAISWDPTMPGNPSLSEGKARSGKMVVGGVSHTETMVSGTPEQVAAEVERGIQETGGRGYAIGPGCTFSPATDRRMLLAALEARERLAGG